MTQAASLELFSPAVRGWFGAAFESPTRVQEAGWASIAKGDHTLMLAPTGSGKTLAAFLWCLDQLANQPPPLREDRCRVLYISPLRALSYEIERNLTAPLAGIAMEAERRGLPPTDIAVATRTGDTAARDRRRLTRTPPDVLITTPESLYLLLTSNARRILRSVETVIVDEIHAVAGTKRGAHLALSLERLDHLIRSGKGEGKVVAGEASAPQRIGLSATQRPLSELARFLGGAGRSVSIVDAGVPKKLELEVIVPVEDMRDAGQFVPANRHDAAVVESIPDGRSSIWPSIHVRLIELIRAHTTTLVFVNNRRLAERLASRVNELAGEELVLAHHGSIARDRRLVIEDSHKAGRVRGIVATSSLELGIDMGAIDLVVQVESPPSISSGLQRIGRGGHTVDATSVGKFMRKFSGDLLETAVAVRQMELGAIEPTRVPRNPLDVLAQQIVAMCAMEPWSVDELEAVVRGSYPFSELSREALEGVLDMLSGRYPSDEFAELRPRIVWDRAANVLSARGDAKMFAVTSGGTIPDRGLYGVFLGEGGPRVGELDEEMVYEARPGETFLLGASTWRIEQITPNQVIGSPAPGEPGKMPFWHGDSMGRSAELGRALGTFIREISAMPRKGAVRRLLEENRMDEHAARNLLDYLEDEREATGDLPSDRTIVVERFRDELGDWRVCVLSPYGGRVHAPWSMAIERSLSNRFGINVQTIWSDDGIAIRMPEGEFDDLDSIPLIAPDDVEDLVVEGLGTAALFGARFREAAARALLLPRRRPGSRTPLWLQRQRSSDLLRVAGRYRDFPILLEAYRECLQDVFDVPALKLLLSGLASRETRIVAVDVSAASPFASSLLFSYVAEFMY